jgi:hypothetical protein
MMGSVCFGGLTGVLRLRPHVSQGRQTGEQAPNGTSHGPWRTDGVSDVEHSDALVHSGQGQVRKYLNITIVVREL